MRLIQLDSYDALQAAADGWNDLWRRSESTLPVAQAQPLLAWLRHFQPHSRFCALAVEHGGQLVAALPIVERRIARAIKIGFLPSNQWTPGGDFLFDPAADETTVLDLLAQGIRRLPWRLLWLEGTSSDLPHWRRFAAALDRSGMQHAYDERFRVGVIEFDRSWTHYQADWSGNHRRHMRKALKRAEQEQCQLTMPQGISDQEIRREILSGFEIEDRGWKGAAGTSVMRSPGILEFFQQQAVALAALGNLELVFLNRQQQPIAFEYGWQAKGVYYSPKVGYDESYSQLTPGQILRYKLLERFFDTPDRRMLDFAGPLADATSKWTTRDYSLGRTLIGTGKLSARPLIYALRTALPKIRDLRRQWLTRKNRTASGDHGKIPPDVAARATAAEAVNSARGETAQVLQSVK